MRWMNADLMIFSAGAWATLAGELLTKDGEYADSCTLAESVIGRGGGICHCLDTVVSIRFERRNGCARLYRLRHPHHPRLSNDRISARRWT
jgi:hypothetical protein